MLNAEPEMTIDIPKRLKEASCQKCWKPIEQCCCGIIEPLNSTHQILILQHPAEAVHPLNTARLVSMSLNSCTHRIGLSWRSLSSALGSPANPKQWGVLRLGKLGENPTPALKVSHLVVIDGTWKQAKALWWRNPWLAKFPRIVLAPNDPSRFGDIRREPRQDALTTLEAVALGLERLEDTKSSDILRRYLANFRTKVVCSC